MKKNTHIEIRVKRPPIVVVMGHIDHGKSTLLDYIRKTNVVAGESGGITQHLSAYEVRHKNKNGGEERITFLDTPGHEAFSAMRARGAKVADVAILVVSAEDSIKAQTLEALQSIRNAKIPFIVAINKIDKPGANPDRVKTEFLEHEVFLEGYGGDVPYVPISAKVGTGVPELLDMLLLVADLAALTGEEKIPAEGVVIEAHINPKSGIAATLIITNGTLTKGQHLVSGKMLAPVRQLEDFAGRTIAEATFSSPVRITGWSEVPEVGAVWKAYEKRSDAEEAATLSPETREQEIVGNKSAEVLIPLIIKTDVAGTLDAVTTEILKTVHEKVAFKIIQKGVGDIGENDVKIAIGSPGTLIIGFRVGIDAGATRVALQAGIILQTFVIIYNITDFLTVEVKKRIPTEEVEEPSGELKVLKIFSKVKDKQVLGGRVSAGYVTVGARVKIMRRDAEIGRGRIGELQQQKIKTGKVLEGTDCGTMIEAKMEIVPGDVIIPFTVITR